ncbi:MAG: pirin family protein [Parachlamydiales bacterium]|nr:pirin family protein [Parachlamydiales bacterium]
MVTVRKSDERGKGDHGWLSTQYTFSFSEYYDSKYMGFRALRVINEDIVAATKGFDTHPHDNMEILTYIINGTLAHKDTMGNQSQITKGEFQLMSAGTGVQHSEFNPSQKEKVHLLQIWIQPNQKGLKPSYQQKSYDEHIQGLKLVVSPDGKEGSLKIHQDARIYLGRFQKAEEISLPIANRHVWIQMIKGTATVNGAPLHAGDGASVSNEKAVEIKTSANVEFLLFDLS